MTTPNFIDINNAIFQEVSNRVEGHLNNMQQRFQNSIELLIVLIKETKRSIKDQVHMSLENQRILVLSLVRKYFHKFGFDSSIPFVNEILGTERTLKDYMELLVLITQELDQFVALSSKEKKQLCHDFLFQVIELMGYDAQAIQNMEVIFDQSLTVLINASKKKYKLNTFKTTVKKLFTRCLH